MYTCQCKGCQMGQSNGVPLKEVAAFGRWPLIGVSLYIHSSKKYPLNPQIPHQPFSIHCVHEQTQLHSLAKSFVVLWHECPES